MRNTTPLVACLLIRKAKQREEVRVKVGTCYKVRVKIGSYYKVRVKVGAYEHKQQ
jgi:hypothetical protein